MGASYLLRSQGTAAWTCPAGCRSTRPCRRRGCLPSRRSATIARRSSSRSRWPRTTWTRAREAGGPRDRLWRRPHRHPHRARVPPRGAHVPVAEINRFRLDHARRPRPPDRGARPATSVKVVNEWTGGTGADVAFEVTALRRGEHRDRRRPRVGHREHRGHPRRAHAREPVQMFAREITMHGEPLYTRGAWEEAIRLGVERRRARGAAREPRVPLESVQEGHGDGARRAAR